MHRNGSHTGWNAAILRRSLGYVSSQLDTTAKLTAATEATIDTVTASWRKSATLSGLYITYLREQEKFYDGLYSVFFAYKNISNELYVICIKTIPKYVKYTEHVKLISFNYTQHYTNSVSHSI